jgi:DNA-binding transcriptional regulator LsrR (DeoR family)
MVNNLSSPLNNNNDSSIVWRRSKVLELASHGHNQSEISRILQISQPTINRDISYLRKQARDNIKKYVDERLPEEYEKCMVGLTSILKEAWITTTSTEDKREKIQALSLAKECYSMKLDLLTNATVIEEAIRFVAEKQQTELKKLSISGHSGKEELQHQQQVTKDIAVGELSPEEEDSSPTTNKVF